MNLQRHITIFTKGRIVWVWLLCQLMAPALHGQWDSRYAELEAAIHNLDEARAEQLLAAEPEPLLRAFYTNFLHYYQVFCSQDERALAAYLEQSDKLIGKIEGEYARHPLRQLLLAEVYWQRGILKVMDQRQLSAIWEFRASYQAINAQAKAQAKLGLHHKTQACFMIALSAIPERYRWAANLLGFQGDLNQGLGLLAQAQQGGGFLATQALMADYYVQRHILAQHESAARTIDSLAATQPHNPMLVYLQAGSYLDRKQNSLAIACLERYLDGHSLEMQRRFPLLQHHLARCRVLAGQYEQARIQLESFLLQYQGKSMRRDAYAKLALCHAFEGRVALASRYFAETLTVPNSGFDADNFATKLAKAWAERPFSDTELDLLRARFAFDGGDMATALRLLAKQKKQEQRLDEEDRTELYYRYARVYHEQGQLATARQHYQYCLTLRAERKLWMKVQAQYYLGVLAEGEGRQAEAKQCYAKVLKYSGYDYQMGLEQKAKAGILRIEKWERRSR